MPENSGPVTVAPAPATPAAPSSQGITFDLNGNRLLAGLILAAVAAVTGGGVSFATQPKEEIAAQTQVLSDMKKDIKDDLKSLESSVDTVAVTIIEVKAKLDATASNQAKLEKRIEDHELRLRALEKK